MLSLVSLLVLSQTSTDCMIYDQGWVPGYGLINGVLSCKGPWDAPSAPCPAGQFVTAVDGGTVSCGTLSATTPAVTTSTPSRTLNSDFRPSTTKAVFATYSVSIACTASLAGGQTSTVELRSDASSTPTTVRSSAGNGNSVSLAIAISVVNSQTVSLAYVVPAGHYVRLHSTGSCTVSLVSQAEVSFD